MLITVVNANHNLKHSQLYSDSEQYKHTISVTLFIRKSDERSVIFFINTKNKQHNCFLLKEKSANAKKVKVV